MEDSEVKALAAQLLELGESDAAASARLDTAVRLALQELTEEYFPIRVRESVQARGGIVPFSAFRHRPTAIYRLERAGAPMPYVREEAGLRVEKDGTYLIDYGYSWEGGPVELPVSLRCAAFGAAGEYCMLAGRYEEASMYLARYRQAAAAKSAKASEIRLAARRWE